MSFQKSLIARIAMLSLVLAVFATDIVAQAVRPTPTVVTVKNKAPLAVAVGNNLYCAGYIQTSAINTGNKIIGSNDEADKYNYAQNDFMYINMGSNKGVSVGDIFAVRLRGGSRVPDASGRTGERAEAGGFPSRAAG